MDTRPAPEHFRPNTARSAKALLLVSLLAPTVSACAGPSTFRAGRPVELPTGQPKNECEQERFYELSPAKNRTSYVTHSTATYIYSREETKVGLSLFRPGQVVAEPLTPALEQVGDERLIEDQAMRVAETERRLDQLKGWRAATWTLFGAATAISAGGMAWSMSGSPTEDNGVYLLYAGLGVLSTSLVALIGAIAVRPSDAELVYYEQHRDLLRPEENDLDRVVVAVARHNAKARLDCTRQTPINDERALRMAQAVMLVTAPAPEPTAATP